MSTKTAEVTVMKAVTATLGRRCAICHETFTIAGTWDTRIFCPECQETLAELIQEKRKEKEAAKPDCQWE